MDKNSKNSSLLHKNPKGSADVKQDLSKNSQAKKDKIENFARFQQITKNGDIPNSGEITKIRDIIKTKEISKGADSLNLENKSSRKASQIEIPSEGVYYNDNHEIIPAFMKKLAQNKNAEITSIQSKINNQDSKDEDSNQSVATDEADDDSFENLPAPVQDVKNLLKNNREFVNEILRLHPEFLKEISAPQHPKFLVISCSDSRIQTSKILGAHPGELFVHRNIGNIVLTADFNIQSVISYGVDNLKVKNIIVLGHTDCGAIKTSLSNKYHGLIDHWLKPVKDVVERNHDYLDKIVKENPEKLTTKLAELNIKEQVLNLCKNPIIQKAWNSGQELYIHGLLFDMSTGYVKDLGIMKKEWKKIADIHALDF